MIVHFVGGPWDDEDHDVPPGTSHWIVPVLPLSFTRTVLAEEPQDVPPQVHLYWIQPVHYSGPFYRLEGRGL